MPISGLKIDIHTSNGKYMRLEAEVAGMELHPK